MHSNLNQNVYPRLPHTESTSVMSQAHIFAWLDLANLTKAYISLYTETQAQILSFKPTVLETVLASPRFTIL